MIVGILLAGGESKRFGKNKLFEKTGTETILERSLQFLCDAKEIDAVCVVGPRSLFKNFKHKKIKWIVNGGATRFASVVNACTVTKKSAELWVIHNAANPFATHDELSDAIRACKQKNIFGAATARQIFGTLKMKNKHEMTTLPRTEAWETETPQVVQAKEFYSATRELIKKNIQPTDDLAVLEHVGKRVKFVPVSFANRKITMSEDLAMGRTMALGLPSNFRIGIGEDGHRFAPSSSRGRVSLSQSKADYKKYLKLGGVLFPKIPTPEADSDGDAILHALCNAIGSAIGLGSLGTYATPLFKKGEKRSEKYVEFVLREMKKKKQKLYNISISINAIQPKIEPHIPILKKNLSKIFKIPISSIGITATTGAELKGDGIYVSAVVLLWN